MKGPDFNKYLVETGILLVRLEAPENVFWSEAINFKSQYSHFTPPTTIHSYLLSILIEHPLTPIPPPYTVSVEPKVSFYGP